eukprot:SAG31_NODE_4208_length_3473_cov_2.441612_2_plen_220_part_00
MLAWYLRFAGLKPAPRPIRCSTPNICLFGLFAHTGAYRPSRQTLERARNALDAELPLFRLYLDDPAATQEAQCRVVVGVVCEASDETCRPATEMIAAWLDNIRQAFKDVAGYNTELTDNGPTGCAQLAPSTDMVYIDKLAAKSIISPPLLKWTADRAFAAYPPSQGGGVRYPRLELDDNWWVEDNASAITYLQPADSASAAAWLSAGVNLHSRSWQARE